jgi:hypothetical protein
MATTPDRGRGVAQDQAIPSRIRRDGVARLGLAQLMARLGGRPWLDTASSQTHGRRPANDLKWPESGARPVSYAVTYRPPRFLSDLGGLYQMWRCARVINHSMVRPEAS